jgi:tetratricopeptide (TPR) repeat protein
MKTKLARSIAVALLALLFVQSSWATCGGGGGGGGGGMSNGGGSGAGNAPTYPVPWKIYKAKDAPATGGLVLFWFPASQNEIKNSSLKESRTLSLYASQCVAMEVADTRIPNADKLLGESQLPVAVLATPDGTPVKKVESKDGKLKVADVEKVVDGEMKQRESSLDGQLKDAAAKVKAGDNDGAIKEYRAVLDQKCLFPKKAKEAAKELKKLGVEVAAIPAAPIFERRQSALIQRTMKLGLLAENSGRYIAADKLYTRAHLLDPADPTPLRFMGENYRHNIGDWNKARTVFETILNMPADPLSRSVALHGLGKMTIHDGEFKKGLALMERAVAEFPLALAYRNLAVYWNSENDPAKANEYTQQALALDPADPYNLVFAAVFMAANGKKEEALKIARDNVNLMPASYNLAAIYAQNGQRERALNLLRRHFFQYERYRAVREKEMMEARVDAVFESIRTDREFIALTNGADGKLPIPMKGMPATQAGPNR